MILLREKELDGFYLSCLKESYNFYNGLSFFYNNGIKKFNFINTDFEYGLIKKIKNSKSEFNQVERNSIYYYSNIRRLVLHKKINKFSLPSYFVINNFLDLKKVTKFWKVLYLHPLYKAKNAGNLRENFVLSEMIKFLSKSELVDIKNSDISGNCNYLYDVYARAKFFINNHKDVVDIEKIKRNKEIKELLLDNYTFQSIKDCNVDTFFENFDYLHKEVLILCISHLEKDDLLRFYNGHIYLNKNFIDNYLNVFSQETKYLKNELSELHEVIKNGSHTLSRCDDKDVQKLFKKGCYAKI